MGWIQRNIGLILLVVGVGAAILMFRQTQIDQCVATSTRAAFIASFATNASQARRADGNERTADFYEAVSAGLLSRLPRPEGRIPADLGGVVVVQRNGVTGVELTPRSAKLIREGCGDAYTPF